MPLVDEIGDNTRRQNAEGWGSHCHRRGNLRPRTFNCAGGRRSRRQSHDCGPGPGTRRKLARSISPRAAGLHIDLEDFLAIGEALADGEPIDHLVLTPVYGGNQSIKDFKVEEALRAARIKIVAFAEIVSKALPA